MNATAPIAPPADADETTPSPQDRIVSLINLTNELSSLMAEENALIRNSRPSAIAPLQERKAKLASAYAVAIREMAADRNNLARAGDSLLQDLRAITARFEEQAAEQRAILSGTTEAVEGVIRSIAEEARPKTSAYGQPRIADAARPIAIDQRG